MRNSTVVLITTLLGVAASAFGQAGGVASISGTVHDPTGAVVANGKVVVSSASKGDIRSIETNGDGVFTAPALIPGPGYELTITAPGFSPYNLKDISLQVGQNLNMNISLSVAQSTTEVDVSSAAQLIDDQKTDVSQVIGDQLINNLPINGRRVDSFVLSTPGVTNDATFGLLSFRGVAGNNSFLLDGNDNTEQFYDENAGRTRIQSQLSQEVVQEFQVVTDDYSAEYGRAMGGVVNTVTKSGGNAVHGDGFYFFRSTGFDARDTFAAFNPSEKRVEGGGTVGGPIIKNKLFYFLGFDLTYRNFPLSDSYVLNGVINTATQSFIGCGLPATPAQCNAINSLLPRFFGQIARTDDNDLGFGKIDYRLNDKNSFVGEFNFLRWFSPNGIQTGLSSTSGAGINGNGDDSVRVRNGKFGWTFVPTNTMVNVFRFGWDTDRQADSFNQASLGGGLGYLDVSVAGVQLGPANYLPRVEPNETRYEYADDLTWTKGRHTLKFGFNASSTEDYVYYFPGQYGSYTYLTPTAFAQDYSGPTAGGKNWTSYSQLFGNPVADYTINEYAWYVQDQWKVTPRFTATLGVRWDKSTTGNFPVVNPDYPQTGRINSPSTNFAPRIGLAYRVDDKTVIRAGYGMFYARMLGGLIDNLYTSNGIYQISDTFNATNPTQYAVGPSFPNALPAAPAGAGVGASNLQFAAPNLKTPYSQQANFSFSRELPWNMVLSPSLIWSRGVNLYGVTDLNVQSTTSYTYKIEDVNGNQTGTFTTPIYTTPRPNTKYGSILEDTNGTNSYYDALAVTLEKRFSHGFQSLISYTYSHEIDEGQGGATSAIFFSSLASYTYNGNYGYERGSGLLDQRHRFVYSFIWAPPVPHANNAFLKYVADGWQLSGIVTLATGHPSGSPTIRIVSAPTLASGSILNTSTIDGYQGGNTRVPFLPVNDLYTPAFYRADLRVTKAIPLGTERVKLMLIGEAFNISNTWSPTALFSQAYTATKGVLQATPSAIGYGSADGGFPDGTQARRLQIGARLTF
jgi:outer membrane receptor protein involved in Fe transport